MAHIAYLPDRSNVREVSVKFVAISDPILIEIEVSGRLGRRLLQHLSQCPTISTSQVKKADIVEIPEPVL